MTPAAATAAERPTPAGTVAASDSVARRLVRRFPPSVFSIAAILLAWQWASGLERFAGVLPPATDTLSILWTMIFQTPTWTETGITLGMALLGLLLAVAIALPAGIAVGLSRFAFLSTRGTLDFLRVIPPIVIVPIVSLVMGPTFLMGVVVVAWPILFVVSAQAAYGVRDTDPVLIDTMRCYGLGTLRQVLSARLPSAAPLIAFALRISVVMAFLGAVLAGIIGGAPGLGRDLMYAQLNGDSTTSFAIVIFMGIIGMIIGSAVTWAQRKIIFWVPS